MNIYKVTYKDSGGGYIWDELVTLTKWNSGYGDQRMKESGATSAVFQIFAQEQESRGAFTPFRTEQTTVEPLAWKNSRSRKFEERSYPSERNLGVAMEPISRGEMCVRDASGLIKSAASLFSPLHNKKWSAFEKSRLAEQLKFFLAYNAKVHGRTEGAIANKTEQYLKDRRRGK